MKQVNITLLLKAIEDNGFRKDYLIDKVCNNSRSTFYRRLKAGKFKVEEFKVLKKLKLV